MELRRLGRTDLHVSALGLGVMTFGAKTAQDDAFRQLDMAFEAGVTLFDTAENYPAPLSPATQGRSEAILGQWIAARGVRHSVVIATKVAGPGNAAGDLTHLRGANRRLDLPNIRAAVDASLARLGTDYIDLYQVHWPERAITTLGRSRFSNLPDAETLVPLEETLEALSSVVKAGKVRHVGVCNETPWGLMRYLAAADRNALPRLVTIQCGYSLLDRQFEIGLAEVAMRERVGLLAYSPLARGLLSGKHSEIPDPRFSTRRHAVSAQYVQLAREHGLDPAAMALAFVRDKPFTTAVLAAASSATQLQNNLDSIHLTLSKELLKAIDVIHDDRPNPR